MSELIQLVVPKGSALPACCRVPENSCLVLRDRIHQRIAACEGLVWLQGPAGMGKTSVAAGFAAADPRPVLWYELGVDAIDPALFFDSLSLSAGEYVDASALPVFSPEYRPNPGMFAARFFRGLSRQVGSPILLVLDNCEVLDQVDYFPLVLSCALNNLPEGSTVLVTSRTAPPRGFSRERTRGRYHVLGPEVLALDDAEALALVRVHRPALSDSAAQALAARADGWPALLALFAEASSETGEKRFPEEHPTIQAYLEEEVFDALGDQSRRVLTSCAFCALLDRDAVIALSGDSSAPDAFAGLAARGLLVTRQGGLFRLHPLLGEYLQQRARRELEPTELTRVMRNTVEVLLSAGRYDEAIPLLRELGEGDRLAQVLLQQAPELFARNRVDTLMRWLDGVPPEARRRDPWLLFWEAQCLLDSDPAVARELLDQSHQAFLQVGDAVGRLSAWTAAVDTYWREWRSFADIQVWLDRLPSPDDSLFDQVDPVTRGRVAVNMFMTLAMCRPGAPDLAEWEQRALEFLQQDADSPLHYLLCLCAMSYFTVVGSYAKSRLLYDHLAWLGGAEDVPPILRQHWYLAEGIYLASYMPDPEAVMQAFRNGMAVARETGVALLDYQFQAFTIVALLGKGAIAEAERLLDQLGAQLHLARPMDQQIYLLARSWLALCKGQPEEALAFAEQSVVQAESFHVPQLLFKGLIMAAHTAHACGRRRLAGRYLGRANRIRRAGSTLELDFLMGMEAAWSALQGNRLGAARTLLTAALAIGRKAGCRQFVAGYTGSELARLLGHACEWGIEPEYVRSLIHSKQLLPPENQRPEHWPWRLRIYALGGFAVHRDGEPLKGTGRPADLLKLLVAEGGERVRQEHLSDLLWPEADGDAARAAFDTTLSRLRRWLGVKDALVLHDGRLSLNAALCWVDADAFEQRAHAVLKRQSADACAKVLKLYSGAFLPEELEYAIACRREQLAELHQMLERVASLNDGGTQPKL